MTDPIDSRVDVPYERSRSALLIADDPVLIARASDAVSIFGGRIVAQLGWAADAAAIGAQSGLDALLIEAEHIDADRLAALLPAINALALSSSAALVVALSADQIDVVAAHVLGRHAQLLCAPTVAERVAALIMARNDGAGASVNDRTSEAESERLKRLNEEVARIVETLARLTQRDSDGTPPPRAGLVGDRALAYAPPPSDIAGQTLAAPDIRRAIRSRRLRDKFFADALFEDPAWDMLLDLFAAHLENAQVSVSSLCIAAAVPPTTALRWITKMSAAGLLERQPDPFDRRRAYMALSATARDGMHGYVDAVRRAGLDIA